MIIVKRTQRLLVLCCKFVDLFELEYSFHVVREKFSKSLYVILYNELYLKEQFNFHLFELEHFKKHLIELEHLPEHLIGEMLGARTMT